MIFPRIGTTALLGLLLSSCATAQKPLPELQCPAPKVPVYGFAQAFVGDAAIANAKITVIGTGENFTSDQTGQFAFCALPHQRITLVLNKTSHNPLHNFQTTQTATVWVGAKGLRGTFEQVTFQVPRKITFAGLKEIFSTERNIKLDPSRCSVGVDLTAYNKTLADDPQGEVGATVLLWHNKKLIKNPPVFYVGILFGKTNPFQTKRTSASADGGAIIYNLEPSNDLYYVSGQKPGKQFSTIAFLCRPNTFINLSPPYGPRVLKS